MKGVIIHRSRQNTVRIRIEFEWLTFKFVTELPSECCKNDRSYEETHAQKYQEVALVFHN